MLKEFVDRLVQLAAVEMIEVGGRTYSSKKLEGVFDPTPIPLGAHTLTGVKDYITEGIDPILNEIGRAHV